MQITALFQCIISQMTFRHLLAQLVLNNLVGTFFRRSPRIYSFKKCSFQCKFIINKIDFTHNPFSMPQGGMDALLNKDPLEIFAYQYDIVCNGVELSSGAVRNHNPEIMRKAFEIAGYGEEDLKAKFGALYTAFAFGAPPHAGMAPGVDRMIMLIAGEETIRDVIAFPLNGNAQDLMMGAPGGVTEQQLREVHIKVRD